LGAFPALHASFAVWACRFAGATLSTVLIGVTASAFHFREFCDACKQQMKKTVGPIRLNPAQQSHSAYDVHRGVLALNCRSTLLDPAKPRKFFLSHLARISRRSSLANAAGFSDA